MSASVSSTSIQFARPLSLNAVLRQRNALGGVRVPVNPSLGYVRFKHVRGIPSRNQPGLSLDKVKMIDNLLDRLSQDPRFTRPTESRPMEQEIMALAEQLHDKAVHTKPSGYAPVSAGDGGLLFSLLV
ncbi:MAG: hypothetical protein ACOCYG_00550 [Spirochaetota bacterium]